MTAAAFALALGVPPAPVGSQCAICGESPFGPAGPARRVLGANFTGQAELHSHPDVCEGCARCLAGRPGDDPPPLRTRTVAVVDGELVVLKRADVWELLMEPHPGLEALSWATGGQRHHWLHAGHCDSERLVIGSDDGPIEYVPARHRAVLEAVAELIRGGFTRVGLPDGQYHPKTVMAFGAARWAALARTLAPYRGSALLSLACWAAPKRDPAAVSEGDGGGDMIEEATREAAELVYGLAAGSSVRSTDGKTFWGGMLAHRLNRFGRLPLEGFVARLLVELGVAPHAATTAAVLERLAGYDGPTTAAVEKALRERGKLVVALAYGLIQERRAARKGEGDV